MVDPDFEDHMRRTYTSLRRLMAAVAAAFLLTLVVYRQVGHDPKADERTAISMYYHHDDTVPAFPMRAVFVAALAAMGLLLVAYQGYTDLEDWLLNCGGVFLLGVVFFPTANTGQPDTWRDWVHNISAASFFVCIAAVCVFCAKDTLTPTLVPNRARRWAYRSAYTFLGIAMLVVPPLVYAFARRRGWTAKTFWVEWAGVAVFLTYWVVKSIEVNVTGLETRDGQQKLREDREAATAAQSPPRVS